MRHFLEVDDVSESELRRILDLAEIAQPEPVLLRKGVALIFQKPSNRTRNSTEMAVVGLGGHPVTLQGDEVGIGHRETVADVTRVLARYHAVLGARVFDHGVLEEMAKVDEVPVVNLLSDRAHPCQALADVLTLRHRWGDIAGRRLAWVGDGNNVARSLILACTMLGADIRLACPAGHEPDPVAVDAGRSHGAEVSVVRSPEDAVEGADAVCTDVWVSMGQEEEAGVREDAFSGYRVDAQLMGRAAPGALFMHCMPAHRGKEVAATVIDGPASVVFDQAENRMHATRGLLLWLMAASS